MSYNGFTKKQEILRVKYRIECLKVNKFLLSWLLNDNCEKEQIMEGMEYIC